MDDESERTATTTPAFIVPTLSAARMRPTPPPLAAESETPTPPAEVDPKLAFEMRKWEEEKHERERAVLFSNESFALSALQTVSAAAAFGVISQFTALTGLAGIIAPTASVTIFVAALAMSVWAAVFRHHYKLADVKGRDREKVQFFLGWMREFMNAAAFLIGGGLAFLVGALWVKMIGAW